MGARSNGERINALPAVVKRPFGKVNGIAMSQSKVRMAAYNAHLKSPKPSSVIMYQGCRRERTRCINLISVTAVGEV